MIALDTDILIDVLRGNDAARTWFTSATGLLLPGHVMMELIQGCADQREVARLQRSTKALAVIWPTQSDCDRALTTYASLRLSSGIGMINCLIAQTAIGHGLRLASFKGKHYAGVKELSVFEPYVRSLATGL